MNIKKVLLGLTAVTMLGGCSMNGLIKTSYEKFHEKAVEAAKEEMPEFSKIRYTGTYKLLGKEYKLDKVEISKDGISETATATDLTFIATITVLSGNPAVAAEDKDASYYTGNGFKMKKDENVVTWDKYLRVTSSKSSEHEVSIKYIK